MTMNQLRLSPLLFLATLLAAAFIGSPVFCMAANLRANSTFSSSEETITVSDSDVVGTRSFFMVTLEGYDMENLFEMSPKKHAILDCAFRQAFDEVHGDRDGLYLSGQQIVAINEEDPDDATGSDGVDDTLSEGSELNHKPYVRRPRIRSKKFRPRPPYPPPKPPPRQYSFNTNQWSIYWYIDASGRCNMCPDDDSMETTSLLLDTNIDQTTSENLALASKKARDEGIASDFIMSEASVNSVADAMRAKLIEGTCATKGDNEHSFEYVRDTDIFVLSQSEFEASVAAITTSKEVTNAGHSTSASIGDFVSSHPTSTLLPFYFGESFLDKGTVAAAFGSKVKMVKIGMSGVGCGPWNNEALLDMNSGLHDSINSLGFADKGHVIDKIVGRKNLPLLKRRYVWKCHYDIYAKVDVDGGDLDEPSLTNIGDALCDDMVRNGSSEKFGNTIDCQLQVMSATEYESIVATNEEAGLLVSSARE